MSTMVPKLKRSWAPPETSPPGGWRSVDEGLRIEEPANLRQLLTITGSLRDPPIGLTHRPDSCRRGSFLSFASVVIRGCPYKPGGMCLPDQVLDPLLKVLGPQRKDGGNPLLHDRSDEAEGAVEKDEPEGTSTMGWSSMWGPPRGPGAV